MAKLREGSEGWVIPQRLTEREKGKREREVRRKIIREMNKVIRELETKDGSLCPYSCNTSEIEEINVNINYVIRSDEGLTPKPCQLCNVLTIVI